MGVKLDDLKDMDTIFTGISNALDSFTTMNDAENKIIATQKALKFTTEKENIARENTANLNHRKTFLTNSSNENKVKIKELIADIRRYNVNAVDWSNLDELHQTEEGKALLEKAGVEYGENFDYREKFDVNVHKQLNNTQGLIGLQDIIIDDLEKKRNAIFALQDDYLKVRDVAGYRGLKDSKDIMAYMKTDENKDRYFESEIIDGKKVYGNMKPLGHAFMTPKKKAASGIEYGFAPENFTASQLKQSGINPQTGQPVAEELSFDLRTKVDALKNSINTATTIDNDTEIKEGISGKRYSKSLGAESGINVTQLLSMLEGKNIYSPDNQKAIQDHKQKIGDAILGMYSEAIKTGVDRGSDWFFGGEFIERDEKEMEALKNLGGFTIDPGTGQPFNMDQGFKPKYLNAIIDRYIGKDMSEGVYPDGSSFPIANEREKIPHGTYGRGGTGLLNRAYSEDRIYHGQKPEGMDVSGWRNRAEDPIVKYGTTSHDEVFFRLMDLYKGLDELDNTFLQKSLDAFN